MATDDTEGDLCPMTDQGLALVTTAARRAAAGGAGRLDAGHLLWAATYEGSSRRLLAWAGADPDGIARKLEPTLGAGPPRRAMPDFTPAATRALSDADRICRRCGAKRISPQHLLLALAGDPGSETGRLLQHAKVTPESIENAAAHHPMP